MKTLDFNQDWTYYKLHQYHDKQRIDLPHDAMREESRSIKNDGGGHVSYHAGSDYQYVKTFYLSSEYRDHRVFFEFEGVYRNANVLINGQKVSYRPYGYTNFYVDATPYLKFDRNNKLEVIVYNSDQPNSRWYSGSGIYRPVNMHLLPQKHVLLNGIKIKTLETDSPRVAVKVETNAPGELTIAIKDSEKIIAKVVVQTTGTEEVELTIPKAKLWSPTSPYLYQCEVNFQGATYTERFGIRRLEWSTEHGLEINGERVILKGACIHHDNGLLGAAAYSDAERRKVQLIKNVGYNAIRSAHNPCSKAMLDACDELGVLVMDEYVDMWYIHKTKYDYADYMQDWWKEDLKDMVNKDYNHPSVILYSTGNEVSETAQQKGIDLTGAMTDYVHQLDPTRPVTCGVNIFFNYLSSLGFGVYSDEKASKENKKKPVGSEFYNKLAGLLGDKTMKVGATLHGCDVRTRDAFHNMDIAGYNYGILRYKKDLRKYPDRLILGTETFCKDAFTFMEIAKKNPRIIGDFVWAGIDYLGEVGIGSWVYEDYAPRNSDEAGWMTAGSGRIDITGRELGEALYTKVALEKETGPLIAVRPVYQTGKHTPSAWKMTDAMPSWTWPECEGMKATVEIYAKASYVKMYLNNKFISQKKIKNDCKTILTTKYQPGELTVVAYDRHDKEIARHSLVTAKERTVLSIEPESQFIKPSGLVYVRLAYTDLEGVLKPMEKHSLKVEVSGGQLVGLGHACPYNPDGYTKSTTKTYYGEAMAIVKAYPDTKSDLVMSVSDEVSTKQIHIPVRKE